MPMFTFTIFKVYNSLISVYFLHNNFKLVVPFNITYLKTKYTDIFKFDTYLLKSLSTHWVRVIFRGKGFRLRKFKSINKLTLNFGHSHWTKIGLYRFEFFFKKIRRQNYICLIKKYAQLKLFKKIIKKVKSLNVYTKRGLRLKKQFIRRRFGKISQVVSSLH
jgi:hypothetical protein